MTAKEHLSQHPGCTMDHPGCFKAVPFPQQGQGFGPDRNTQRPMVGTMDSTHTSQKNLAQEKEKVTRISLLVQIHTEPANTTEGEPNSIPLSLLLCFLFSFFLAG